MTQEQLVELAKEYLDARRKKALLTREVGAVEDDTLRTNMDHSLSKLWGSVSNMLDHVPGARAEVERQMKARSEASEARNE